MSEQDFLAAPVEIPQINAFRAISTVANIDGIQIALLGGSVKAIAAAWARLVPNVPFNPDKHQYVIVLSAKEPIFTQTCPQ